MTSPKVLNKHFGKEILGPLSDLSHVPLKEPLASFSFVIQSPFHRFFLLLRRRTVEQAIPNEISFLCKVHNLRSPTQKSEPSKLRLWNLMQPNLTFWWPSAWWWRAWAYIICISRKDWIHNQISASLEWTWRIIDEALHIMALDRNKDRKCIQCSPLIGSTDNGSSFGKIHSYCAYLVHLLGCLVG